jgi:hypothetical protein
MPGETKWSQQLECYCRPQTRQLQSDNGGDQLAGVVPWSAKSEERHTRTKKHLGLLGINNGAAGMLLKELVRY